MPPVDEIAAESFAIKLTMIIETCSGLDENQDLSAAFQKTIDRYLGGIKEHIVSTTLSYAGFNSAVAEMKLLSQTLQKFNMLSKQHESLVGECISSAYQAYSANESLDAAWQDTYLNLLP